MFFPLSLPAMAAEENKGDGSLTTQRQRFYVELKHGETTIVSWKKLLKEARKKNQCPLPSSGPYSSSSTAPKTQDNSCDAGQCNDSVIRNKRVKHVETSSDHIKQSKHRVKMTKVEGEKNDDDSSVQLARPNEMNGKVTSEITNLLKHSSSPAKIKGLPPKEVRASTVDVPLLTYSKRRTVFRSKPKCPPLNAVEDACVFPLKTTHNVVQKNQNISIEGSKMKVGVGGHSYDAMHQKIEEYFPVMIESTSGMLHDEVSSKSWHNDKSGGSRELVDAIPPCYKSPMKDSGHNVVDTVKTKHVRAPCKKRKATDSSSDFNSVPFLPKKMASKKAAIELPALQCNSSDSLVKGVKLTLKQKPLVPQQTNVKVRFLLKQEHETLKSNEKDAKDVLNHSSSAASATCKQPAYP